MISKEIRKKFLVFFEKRGHKVVPSSSLIPKDPSVLLTTAGVQQFKPYYLGEKSPFGPNTASCQKSFRTSDIDEVGDDVHLTFFEMLGNFSFGGYFKEKTIRLAIEFLTEDLKLNLEDLQFSYFKGEKSIPEDIESREICQKLGIPKEKIFGFGRKDNFWGPTGLEGPCGPTIEIHYPLSGEVCEKGKDCIPNCDCGRFVELWNLVFNEYYQNPEGKLTLLEQKGVDTGMGFDRLTMVLQKKPSVFETDLFWPIIQETEKRGEKFYSQNPKPYRIIADHIKGSVFLISEGILPSNVERGYILRRILRRAIIYGKLLNLKKNTLIFAAKKAIEIYKDIYLQLKSKETDILTVIQNEEEKFEKTLERGMKEATTKIKKKGQLTGDLAFSLYESYGIPLEFSQEIAKGEKVKISDRLDIEFKKSMEKHQEISRVGAEKKFGGIGKEATYEATKLHTATHLLHQALREVLGSHIQQMGSDITSKRLRFDFSHSQKATKEEIEKIEKLVNEKIKEDLEMQKKEIPYQQALKEGALAFFREKYPEKVIVYSVGNFSKEICAGPHVKRTSELGKFKITKEESAGAGIRRIRAVLE